MAVATLAMEVVMIGGGGTNRADSGGGGSGAVEETTTRRWSRGQGWGVSVVVGRPPQVERGRPRGG
eukprot:1602413-Alexandrium_andersonii.AAC.1